ncbi:Predicted signal transduction protein [hydrothermal vent metagenome]|uniref:Predicted signal transduction protein n=1 Tax=hydrothermal vent metagenome TaxID=652676 RepID=A0A3B0W4T3_9ZZZZ
MQKTIDVYIGRQPIFNGQMKVVAYELLFRSSKENNHAVIVGGDVASAQVMMSAFGDIGLSEILGEHQKAFINFTEGLLLKEYQDFYPKNKIVIEVLEDVQVTSRLTKSLTLLKQQGYTIALDDYIFSPELEPLEPFSDIIKVDLLEVELSKLEAHIDRLKAQGIRLLAEKVETQAQYKYCQSLGFDYFQGYFFAKPNIIEGKRLPNNKLTLLDLLAKVYDPDIDMSVLSMIIAKDVGLSHKLLRFLSETTSNKQPVVSIHDAVLRFGLRRLQSWTSMLVLSGVEDKPIELFITALIRARFCELLGERLGGSAKEVYFTVGLFSCLDAVMDSDLSGLVKKLELDEEIQLGIVELKGRLGCALNIVKQLEKGAVNFDMPQEVSATELSQLYLQAMQFAERLEY